MLTEKNLHEYQRFSVEHIIQNKYCGLFLDLGLGKTISTLTAINELMYNRYEIDKVLIIAPKRVAEHTWVEEIKNWEHVKHLTISICVGSEKQRVAALNKKADIYTINRENVPWLVAYLKGEWPFELTVIDELSSFKDGSSGRFKALKVTRPQMSRVIGLTATPAPNSLIDLWSQIYLLDKGDRLGKTITSYRQNYFSEGKRNGHIVYEYNLKTGNDKEIYDRIGDICISMKASDWLQLPDRVDNDIWIDMPAQLAEQYEEFEKEAVMSLGDEAKEISAVNAAALSGKLLQFSNGAVYDSSKNYHEIHNLKIQALEETLEAANGNPVLCFYNFRHDVDRIKKHLKAFKPHELGGASDITRWNNGEIPFMLAHPASAGHGLNMQKGGHLMAWYGLPWSLELYQQAVARLHRQGQGKSVINYRFLLRGTLDAKVLRTLDKKAVGQDELMNAVKAIIKKHRG